MRSRRRRVALETRTLRVGRSELAARGAWRDVDGVGRQDLYAGPFEKLGSFRGRRGVCAEPHEPSIMKLLRLALVLALSLIVSLLLYVSLRSAPPSIAASTEGGRHEAQTPRSAATLPETLSATLERVLMRLDELTARVEQLERAPRRDVALDTDLSPAPGLTRDQSTGVVTPQEWLRLYVASFEDSSEGEELYRLHVRAELGSLLAPVAALVASPAHVTKLRTRLAELLNKPKLASNTRVVDALIVALVEPDSAELASAALESLASIGGRVIAHLERALWSITDTELRHAALRVVVRADTAGPDVAIERLFRLATKEQDRVYLLSLLEGAPLEAALATVRAATNGAVELRLAAAGALGKLHGDAVVALVRWWLGFERDERVRDALGAAEQSASQTPSYHAKQACGPPDAQGTRDDPAAWACQEQDDGEQWIELTYDPPLRAAKVIVHEIGAPGGVRRLIGYDEAGAQHELWSGVDRATSAGPAEFSFPTTSFRVTRVRIVIDTSARTWWEEIDAVQLAGPDGAGWAVEAVASSNYGS